MHVCNVCVYVCMYYTSVCMYDISVRMYVCVYVCVCRFYVFFKLMVPIRPRWREVAALYRRLRLQFLILLMMGAVSRVALQ